MDPTQKMRRPSTSKRVLRAIDRALKGVDQGSLTVTEREEHRAALRWLKKIRRFNEFNRELRDYWARKREEGGA